MDRIVLAMALGLAAIVSLIFVSMIPVGVPHVDPATAWAIMSAQASCKHSGCAEEIIRNCDASSEIAVLRAGGDKAWTVKVMQADDSCRISVGDVEFGHASPTYRCDIPLAELAGLKAESFDKLVSNITELDSCRKAVQ